jgi:SAM-dependent methyltransferase
MMIGALAPYETSLAGAGPLAMLADDGDSIVLDVERYLAAVDAADSSVLDRCRGPVLDVGCGPGRMVGALAERGMAALGVDIAPMAVELTRSRGVPVLLRDLFERVPGEGRWPTALVIDGNIGIGGDVDRVLRRLDTLLAADGRAVIETAPEPMTDRTLKVRFARDAVATGPQFAWSLIGTDALATRAARVGFTVLATWSVGHRNFVELGHSDVDQVEVSAAGAHAGVGELAPGRVQSTRVASTRVEAAHRESARADRPDFTRARVRRGPAWMAHPLRRQRGA